MDRNDGRPEESAQWDAVELWPRSRVRVLHLRRRRLFSLCSCFPDRSRELDVSLEFSSPHTSSVLSTDLVYSDSPWRLVPTMKRTQPISESSSSGLSQHKSKKAKTSAPVSHGLVQEQEDTGASGAGESDQWTKVEKRKGKKMKKMGAKLDVCVSRSFSCSGVGHASSSKEVTDEDGF